MDDEENYSEEEEFEDDNEDSELGTYLYKASYVIVAIDTHSSMFQRDKNGTIPFRNCLESCLRILNSLIFVKDSKTWNPFAVLLTKDDPKLIDFGDNIIESVKFLQSKLKLSDQELEDEFQRKNDFDLAEFLLQCKKAFHDIKAAFYKRILVFITNDDNPVKNAQSKFAAINEVKSFDASEISFEVIPTNLRFDFSLLYNEMFTLLTSKEAKEEICTDVDGLEQKLSSVLVPKSNKKKVYFYPFKGDTKRYLTCFDFKLDQSPNLLSTKVTAEGKDVKPKPEPMSEDLPTYTLETPTNFKTNVVFDLMAKHKLYNSSLPKGYTLVCIGKSYFGPFENQSANHLLQVHPNEEREYLKKFWQYCIANDRVLICMVKFKQPGNIKFCQMNPIMFGGVPTFLCKELPFADDYETFTFTNECPKIEKDEEKYELVRKLVDKLTIDFHPDMIPDPKYRKKLGYVKSKLLDEPFEDNIEVFDHTSLDARIREEVESIKEAFGVVDDPNANTKRKRAANPTTAASRKKKN